MWIRLIRIRIRIRNTAWEADGVVARPAQQAGQVGAGRRKEEAVHAHAALLPLLRHQAHVSVVLQRQVLPNRMREAYRTDRLHTPKGNENEVGRQASNRWALIWNCGDIGLFAF